MTSSSETERGRVPQETKGSRPFETRGRPSVTCFAIVAKGMDEHPLLLRVPNIHYEAAREGSIIASAKS